MSRVDELIEKSVKSISGLETYNKQLKLLRTLSLAFVVLCGILALSLGSMIAVVTNVCCAIYFSFLFAKKTKEVNEAEELLENAKFNESYLRAMKLEQENKF